jgi:hypothetical protein
MGLGVAGRHISGRRDFGRLAGAFHLGFCEKRLPVLAHPANIRLWHRFGEKTRWIWLKAIIIHVTTWRVLGFVEGAKLPLLCGSAANAQRVLFAARRR